MVAPGLKVLADRWSVHSEAGPTIRMPGSAHGHASIRAPSTVWPGSALASASQPELISRHGRAAAHLCDELRLPRGPGLLRALLLAHSHTALRRRLTGRRPHAIARALRAHAHTTRARARARTLPSMAALRSVLPLPALPPRGDARRFFLAWHSERAAAHDHHGA